MDRVLMSKEDLLKLQEDAKVIYEKEWELYHKSLPEILRFNGDSAGYLGRTLKSLHRKKGVLNLRLSGKLIYKIARFVTRTKRLNTVDEVLEVIGFKFEGDTTNKPKSGVSYKEEIVILVEDYDNTYATCLFYPNNRIQGVPKHYSSYKLRELIDSVDDGLIWVESSLVEEIKDKIKKI